ncbi:pantoate--beta-alanine ligase [Halopseudomonas laoshanensis]|jgi:pantoate--beta-alanine ligase|uniref:Pantothenate synthetase n=1 Tax=Halopseudomonas laoshanensis TaxID=2268758 RepID=A0A7V7GMN2_9GAMM|nr:pantoate--beta-alanine ligase [Halopseudomonas laoshanensis]KAA0690472.1 pantoate--beta-alanine ligase [Halopseudomonas laoshanensis]MBQ0743886.1 pantoate--beta-alanine ligase [Pseudomonas sp.]MBQ0777897.1 pantoate--beta-alanine ligase [Pseudomonas sp.]WOD10813.1 pantoate--beta-alanine ligase [Pseudomonas sp. NyZ704]
MNTLHSIAQLRAALSRARQDGKRIGLVPTMGNLHAGHITLVEKARQRTDFVVVSIFVNPLQFAAGEDLESYPRTLEADQRKLLDAGAHLVFAPNVKEMYPRGMDGHTRISVPVVSEGLCGASRPGHFEGVATVVSKLLNIVQPDLAVFGQKDFQQLAVIRKMAQDLCLPVQIMGEPTVRAEDGLALSSRNGYLSEAERQLAPQLYKTLQSIASEIQSGQRDYPALIERARQQLETHGLRADYLDLRDAISLEPVNAQTTDMVVLAAAYVGKTRLIDNLHFELK